MGEMFQPWHLMLLSIIGFFVGLLVLLPFWQIFKKAGFPPALSLLTMVPFLGTIVLYVVAFSEWPAFRKSERQPGQFPPLP
jgi:hypothetical protein